MSDQESAMSLTPISETSEFKKIEKIFAFLSIAFGYLFIKLVLATNFSLGTTLFFLLFIVSSLVFVNKLKVKQSAKSLTYIVTAIVFSLYFTLSANFFLKFLNLLFVIILITLWAFSLNNQNYHGAEDNFPSILLRGLFSEPFGNYSKCPNAITESIKQTKSGSNIKNVIIGLVIALPVTFLSTVLLSCADDSFNKLTSGLFTNLGQKIFVNGLQIFIGIPIAFYLFGMLFSAVNLRAQKTDESTYKNVSDKYRILNPTIIFTSVIPLCLVYVVFFFCQLNYFISAFLGILPDEFSFAEYARKGFFELFAVAIINLMMIIFINLLCKNHNEKDEKPKGLKFFTSLLSIFTLILIATALSKMIMYIGQYGLTPLRVYTTWFMILLSILFVLIIIRQIKKVNIAKIGCVVFTIMFAVLTFSNVDNLIVKYNFFAYQSGYINEFDGSLDVSNDAVYEAMSLDNSNVEYGQKMANNFFRYNSPRMTDIRNFNISDFLVSKYTSENIFIDDSQN